MHYSTRFSHAVSGTSGRAATTIDEAIEILDGLGCLGEQAACRALAEGLWAGDADDDARLVRARGLLLAFAVEGRIFPDQYGRGVVETC